MSETTKGCFDCDKGGINQQLRVLLFGESGLVGRKLIFDSFSCQNALPEAYNSTYQKTIYTLTEMVFGSIASRRYDTCFKVHNLSSPFGVMFTQIFPIHSSEKLQLCRSSSKNLNLLSTNNSLLMVQELTASGSREKCGFYECDTKSTLRTTDSGFTEQSIYTGASNSFSSFSNTDDLFSSREFSKDEIEPSLNNSIDFTTGFTEEYLPKSGYKMGLVVIVLINSEKEKCRSFCMKHIAFIESIMYRVRRTVEVACDNPSLLLSTIVEISSESVEWLKEFFSKAQLFKNDKFNEANSKQPVKIDKLKGFSLKKLFSAPRRNEVQYNVTISIKKNSRSCFKEFCELLQKLETKERNLFMSNLITAILTHHLGWVATCLSSNNSCMPCTKNSYNSLWIQMTELCGAFGYPRISCQTIISASSVDQVISKILHSLTYFIRYSKVEYKRVERINIRNENTVADVVCEKIMKNESNRVNNLTLHRTNKCYFHFPDEKVTWYNKTYIPKQEKLKFVLGDDENSEKQCQVEGHEYKGDNIYASVPEMHAGIKTNCKAGATIPSKFEILPDKILHKVKSDFKMNYQEAPLVFTDGLEKPSDMQMKNLDSFNIASKVFFDQVLEGHGDIFQKLKLLVFPLPRLKSSDKFKMASCASIFQSNSIGKYIPDMVIQGTTFSEKEGTLRVKKDVALLRNNVFCNKYVDEYVTIVGDINKWDVKVFSSSISAINHRNSGARNEISPLVENMLEITLQMWNQHLCINYCITHTEQRLLEICIHSLALAHFLLDTDFCVMDLLTSSLHLQVNDIPLLLSVASTVTPQVTKKYGLSFQ